MTLKEFITDIAGDPNPMGDLCQDILDKKYDFRQSPAEVLAKIKDHIRATPGGSAAMQAFLKFEKAYKKQSQ